MACFAAGVTFATTASPASPPSGAWSYAAPSHPEKDEIVGIEAPRAAPQRAARRGAISGHASREPRTVDRQATALAREAPGGGEPLVHVDPATRVGGRVFGGVDADTR